MSEPVNLANHFVLHKIAIIRKQFLCNLSLDKFAWHDVFTGITWEQQHILIRNTVDFPLVLERPLKLQYQKAFIRFVLDKLLKQNSEIHDAVYEAYGRLVSLVDTGGYCYKHYEIYPSLVLSFKEYPTIVSSGTTGLCSWEASVALADWCTRNYPLFDGKRILELGSGVGVAGIILAQGCSARKIYLTDCHSAVLEVLCENLKLNGTRLHPEGTTLDNRDSLLLQRFIKNDRSGSIVEVHKLAWEEVDENYCKNLGKVDVIIAADVVYDPDLFVPLANTLKCFLLSGTLAIFFACTERNKETLEQFLTVLREKGMSHMRLRDLVPIDGLVWSIDVPIKFFSIKLH